jgi:hypothetical protein
MLGGVKLIINAAYVLWRVDIRGSNPLARPIFKQSIMDEYEELQALIDATQVVYVEYGPILLYLN